MEEQGKAATTISRMMAAMKAFFNYECMQACIRRNPAESLHAPKVEKKAPVILSVDQVSALLAQPSGQTPKEIRDKAMLALLYEEYIHAGWSLSPSPPPGSLSPPDK